jgi:protein involved in polysaccharide export with SLBB domain
MKHWKVMRGLVLGLGLLASALAHSALPTATAEQIRMYQQLPPSQQEAMLRALQGNKGVVRAPAIPAITTPSPSAPQQSATADESAAVSQEPPRLKAGDTVLLRFDSAGANREPKIYTLDRAGILRLPNVGRIPLAGLSEEDAAERLSVEPPLKGTSPNLKILPVHEELKPFGYELFSGRPDAFSLGADMPVPADYVVGPGDTVVIQLYGKDSLQYELPVTREGNIQFPGIGPVPVAGLTFARLQDVIAKRVRRQFIGMRSSTTIGQPRPIQVFVLGDVHKPGTYTVSGLSTLTSAVIASGGVKKIGSLRNVQLKRSGKTITQVDFYDLLLHGDNRADARLQPGDVIFVSPVGKTVGIAGEVRRPAIYELKNEQTVQEIVALAGGLLPSASPQTIQIERIQNGRDRILVDLDLGNDAGRKTALSDGDTIRIRSVLDKTEGMVTLNGHVHRPGTYQWRQGMRITDLIRSVSELPTEVDARYLLIKRESPTDRRIELLNANLAAALAQPKSEADTPLQARDAVYVFSIHDDRKAIIEPLLDQARAQSQYDAPAQEASIYGTVHHAGRYPISSGMKVSDLLLAAGGLTDSAYTLEAELTRYKTVDGVRDQELVLVNLAGVLNKDADKDITIEPYDQLVIRPVPNWDRGGTVTIAGEMRFPGSFPVTRGEKLSDLLKRAGGFSDQAFPKGAVFIRESVKQREQEHLARLANQLEQDLAVAATKGKELGTDTETAVAEGEALLKQLRAAQAVGRVAISLEKVAKGDLDITLQDGDKLYIPQRPDEVTVVGEVYYPTSHIHTENRDRDDYVQQSGGITEKGNKRAIYVVHADGSVSAPGGWFSPSPDVGPGDTIVVPLKVYRLSGLKIFTDVSQVFYQLAVSAAALKVLNVF